VRSPKGDVSVSIPNTSNVQELKQAYLDGAKLEDLTTENVRLFYQGKEIKDSFSLYQYNLKDEMVVQAMVSRK